MGPGRKLVVMVVETMRYLATGKARGKVVITV